VLDVKIRHRFPKVGEWFGFSRQFLLDGPFLVWRAEDRVPITVQTKRHAEFPDSLHHDLRVTFTTLHRTKHSAYHRAGCIVDGCMKGKGPRPIFQPGIRRRIDLPQHAGLRLALNLQLRGAAAST